MCETITKDEKKVLCSRCGEVANPTDSWLDDWPNYGYIKLAYGSCIDWELFRQVSSKSPLEEDFREQELIRAVIDELHPAVKHFGFQGIELEWSAADYPRELKKKYRLCRNCQRQLLAILGKFFFSNLPKEQPIRVDIPRGMDRNETTY